MKPCLRCGTLLDVRQNKYDDPAFFASYSNMQRSRGGLAEAGEWPAFRSLLPELSDKRVLDLGCGFGWHCKYAVERGARSVVGIDISEKMLARARATNEDPKIEYRRAAIEEIVLGSAEFDIVLSSLALHYVGPFDLVCRNLHRCLIRGGHFVFSVEHPIFTALDRQEWYATAENPRDHWPVDDYQLEGIRHTQWMADDVIKYHRTVESYINTVVDSGFNIRRLCEPKPEPEMIRKHPDWKDEARRPMFLLIAAVST